MADIFKIEGLHTIDFSASPYALTHNSRPRGMSKPLSVDETKREIGKLPRDVRGHALKYGMSRIVFTFDINVGTTGTGSEMEDALHDLLETLEDGQLYIETKGARGTRAVVHYKKQGASADSYKTLFYGDFDEASGRQVLGEEQIGNQMIGLPLTLYCEKLWRPAAAVPLGPNEIKCPSFEEDGDGDGTADNWSLIGTPTDTIETTIVLHGGKSQKLVTDAASGQGVQSATFSKAAETQAVAYAWIHRSAGDNIAVEIYDEDATTVRATALYNTAGWPTETGKDDASEFKQVHVSATGLTAGNNHRLRVQRRSGDAAQATTFYVDKCFWKWGTTTKPDEWVDHYLIFNHYDTTEGASHEGHINYFDVDDLKGDVEARTLIRTEFENDTTQGYNALDLFIGRQTKESPSDFPWWLEAEDRTTVSNWATSASAACSAGNRVSDTANVSGYVEWQMAAGAAALSVCGRYDVFGGVYTDDIANTYYRLYSYIAAGYSYKEWTRQDIASQWQLLYLGEINLDYYLRAGIQLGPVIIGVEYQKDAVDTAELDFIWLVPKTEPELRLDPGSHTIDENRWWMIQNIEDFDSHHSEYGSAPYFEYPLAKKGDFITLKPQVENRTFFVCTIYHANGRIYVAHGPGGASDPIQMIVNIDYLPQFISPLE